MTVYVDTMMAEYMPKHRPRVKYIMSHMIADTEEELHAMADQIGVARRWYQRDHYDVTQSCKKRAIELGAVLIEWRVAAAMMLNKRNGYPMGTPLTALRIAHERRMERNINDNDH